MLELRIRVRIQAQILNNLLQSRHKARGLTGEFSCAQTNSKSTMTLSNKLGLEL
jgi:hypothetical protein